MNILALRKENDITSDSIPQNQNFGRGQIVCHYLMWF